MLSFSFFLLFLKVSRSTSLKTSVIQSISISKLYNLAHFPELISTMNSLFLRSKFPKYSLCKILLLLSWFCSFFCINSVTYDS